MKLKELLTLRNKLLNEKKEAVGEVPSLNLTFHLDQMFKNVGDSGKPELQFTISISSTGGKEYARVVGDKAEKEKFEIEVKQALQKAISRLNKNMNFIVKKYQLKAKQEEEESDEL